MTVGASCTIEPAVKSLEAIAVAYLVDRGQISYDAKVTEYWPEFGANGKEGITVADVMRHEAGMANFDSHYADQGVLQTRPDPDVKYTQI